MKHNLLVQNVIVKLEAHILAQLKQIMQHHNFQRLAARWLWLHSISNFADGQIKIQILPLSLQEASNDFKYTSSIESSNLFQKLNLQEYEQAGGEPFGLLLMDLPIELHQVELLANFMKITQPAFLPVLYNITEAWWGLDAASLQCSQIYFREILQQSQYQQWREILAKRASMFLFGVQSSFILASMPCSLTVFADHFTVRAPASYLLTRMILENYQENNWFYDQNAARRRRWFTNNFWQQPANPNDPITQNILTANCKQQQIDELLKINIITLQQEYPNTEVRSESAALMSLLALTRFAHYLKVILREVIGSYIDKENVERVLAQFLNQYCAAKAYANSILQYPLQHYHVQVNSGSCHGNKVNCQVELCLNGFEYQSINWLIQ